MIISISGTHCTGKSTLVEALKKDPRLKNAIFLKSSGRELVEKNPQLKINEDGDFLTQMYILCRDIKQEIENGQKPIVICDRCFLDTFIYSTYLYRKGKIKESNWKSLLAMSTSHPVAFDKHFLLKPSFELQDEVNRSMNKEYQKDIYTLFDNYAEHSNKFSDPGDLIFEYLPDDLESRIEHIINYIFK